MTALNLALRFVLEIVALTGFGVLAWSMASGFWRFVLLVLVVGGAMAVWGTFAVPDDPSRSGAAPVPVSGLVRLGLELALLLGGATAFFVAGRTFPAIALAALVLLHYALSIDRVAWLLKQ